MHCRRKPWGHFSHLSIEEREDVMLFARQHKGVGEIARTIGRDRPAVSRELARNPSTAGAAPCCRASTVQHKHERRRGRCHRQGLMGDPERRDLRAVLSPSECSRRAAEFSRLRRDEYSGDLQRHYAAEMPIWALLELSSFGTVADVYRYCASRWDDAAMLDEHYMLKKARDVRNACAHSAAIINGLGTNGHVARPAPSELTTALREAGFSKRSRSSRMRNPRLQKMATLLLLHRRVAGGTAGSDRV